MQLRSQEIPFVIIEEPEEQCTAKFYCKPCKKLFLSNKTLKSHEKREHATNLNYPCLSCDTIFNSYSDLRQHRIQDHKTEVFPFCCKLCDTRFRRSNELKKHIKVVHDIVIKTQKGKITHCEMCFETFDTLAIKIKHVRKMHPESRVSCRLCPRTFSNGAEQRRHEIQIHQINIDKPDSLFKCNGCGKAFASRHYLIKHLETHAHD